MQTRKAIEITLEEKTALHGSLIDDIHVANCVVSDDGKYCISEKLALMITKPEYLHFKQRALQNGSNGYKNVSESEDLSDVLNSNNLDDEGATIVCLQLSSSNNLQRPDIRFRGIKPSIESEDALVNNGKMVILSKGV